MFFGTHPLALSFIRGGHKRNPKTAKPQKKCANKPQAASDFLK